MARKEDIAFDIAFYESVLRRGTRYAEVVEILGGLYTKTGRIADGLKMDRKLVRLRPDDATAHYNLACSLALMRRHSAALASLQSAVKCGYDDYEWMEEDPDLEGLKKSLVFRTLLASLKLKC